MSDNMQESSYIEENVNSCSKCGSLITEDRYKLKLCKECRDSLIKRPIPLIIKIFTFVVAVVAVISFIRFPNALKDGIEFERGLRAEGEFRCYTAMKHYENVVKDYPDFQRTLVRLYRMYYLNDEIDKADKILSRLIELAGPDQKIDKEIADEVNSTTNELDVYYSFNDELYNKLKGLENPKPEELINLIKPYVDNNSELANGACLLANAYFDLKLFSEGVSVLDKVTKKHPDFHYAILLKSSFYRELGRYDEAIACCNKVLELNKENLSAIVGLSKIELKRKNNAKGLEYANNSYEIDSSDPYVISNLALAYHYNNNIKERDEMFNKYLKSGVTDEYTTNLLTSIFSNTLNWQK